MYYRRQDGAGVAGARSNWIQQCPKKYRPFSRREERDCHDQGTLLDNSVLELGLSFHKGCGQDRLLIWQDLSSTGEAWMQLRWTSNMPQKSGRMRQLEEDNSEVSAARQQMPCGMTVDLTEYGCSYGSEFTLPAAARDAGEDAEEYSGVWTLECSMKQVHSYGSERALPAVVREGAEEDSPGSSGRDGIGATMMLGESRCGCRYAEDDIVNYAVPWSGWAGGLLARLVDVWLDKLGGAVEKCSYWFGGGGSGGGNDVYDNTHDDEPMPSSYNTKEPTGPPGGCPLTRGPCGVGPSGEQEVRRQAQRRLGRPHMAVEALLGETRSRRRRQQRSSEGRLGDVTWNESEEKLGARRGCGRERRRDSVEDATADGDAHRKCGKSCSSSSVCCSHWQPFHTRCIRRNSELTEDWNMMRRDGRTMRAASADCGGKSCSSWSRCQCCRNGTHVHSHTHTAISRPFGSSSSARMLLTVMAAGHFPKV